jgi:hypothetical protein
MAPMPNWTVNELSVALNMLPLTPGIIASLGLFTTPKVLSTTTAWIEMRSNTLALVPSRPRGGPADVNIMGRRSAVPFRIPHFPLDATVLADEVQDLRAFGGTAGTLESFPTAVQEQLTDMGVKLDVTLEHLRLGAIKGVVITRVHRDTGNIEESIDLFDAFGMVAPAPVNFVFDQTADSAWSGAVTTTINTIIDTIEDELGGSPPGGIAALCGKDFYNALVTCAEVRDAYRFADAGAALIAPTQEPAGGTRGFVYRGCRFIRYVGRIGAYEMLDPATAQFFPMGAPDLFIEAYAPADYIETVNTPALPRYAKQEAMDFDKGMMIQSQMNVMPICTRPRTLIPATFTTGGATARNARTGSHAPGGRHPAGAAA